MESSIIKTAHKDGREFFAVQITDRDKTALIETTDEAAAHQIEFALRRYAQYVTIS